MTLVKILIGTMGMLRRVDHYVNGSAALRPDQDFRVDPYPSFEFMRPRGPVLRSFANRGWVVIGFDAARELLRDPNFSSDFRRNRFVHRILSAATGNEPVPFADNPPLLNLDPPDHTRLRKLVSPGFSNRYIQSLAPTITAFVNDLLAKVSNKGQIDVIDALASPLPAWVITEMMGVPAQERGRFLEWSHDLIGATILTRPDLIARASRAEQEMRTYFTGLVAKKQLAPGDDFISKLVSAETQLDSLSREEVIATCILLLSAGHETTTRLIGNGLYTLLRHPQQLAKLRAQRELMEPAIEEMLRFEPPVQMTLRFVKQDTVFSGHKMKSGQMVMVNLAAANRDPEANVDPNTFNIERGEINHLAFGHGIHHCLGMALARLEARIAFNALLDHCPEMSYADDAIAPWQTNPFFRGLDHLRIVAS